VEGRVTRRHSHEPRDPGRERDAEHHHEAGAIEARSFYSRRHQFVLPRQIINVAHIIRTPGGRGGPRQGRARLRREPRVEGRFGHDVDRRAHQRVPGAAEQVADDRVAAQPVRVARQWVVIPGTTSSWILKAGIQNAWITSLERMFEPHRLALGHVQLGRFQRRSAGHRRRVFVGPEELLSRHFDVDLPGGLLFVVVEDDERVADHPSSRTLGMAVQNTSSRVLPWIGGPSLSSSPGFMELPDAVEDHGDHQHEDRDRRDHHHVVEAVRVLRLGRGLDREPLITKLRTMPIAIAITAAMAVMVIERRLDTGARSGRRGSVL